MKLQSAWHVRACHSDLRQITTYVWLYLLSLKGSRIKHTYIHTQIKKSNFSTLFFPLWALKARRRDSNLEMKAPLFSFLSGGTPCAGEKRSFFLSSSYFYLFSAVQNGFSLLPIFPLLPPACWGKSPPKKVSICTFL